MANKKFTARTFKLEDLLSGKVHVPGSRNEGHEAGKIREFAIRKLHEAEKAGHDCVFLSHLVKEYFGEFTRKHYSFAREVFKRQIGMVRLVEVEVDGRKRLVLTLKK